MTEARLREEPLAEFDAEQEFDFARYGRAIAARWWLLAVGLVVGIAVGLVLSLGGNTFFHAETIVYLGQPLAPGGGGALPSPITNPRTVEEIVRSEAVINEVAAKVGLRPGQLRGHVGTRSLQGVIPRAGQDKLYAISVKGRPARRVAAAADAFAGAVVARVSGYPDVKIQQLKEHLIFDERELGTVVARLKVIQRQQQQVLDDRTLDVASRLIAINNFNTQQTTLESRRSNLEQDRFAVRQLLKLAQDIERARVLTPAHAVSSTARSRRNSVLVGALIGLILGGLAAILWDPLAGRFAGRAAQ